MIKVTCTDRGTHPERVLGWLTDERTPENGSGEIAFVPWAAHRQFRMGDRDTRRGTLQVECSVCRGKGGKPRTVRWTQATAARLMDGLIAASQDQIDVSYWTDRVV